MHVWVKVCGLVRPQDALEAVRAGADAVGLILTPRSPRAVSPDQARALAYLARAEAAALGRKVRVVGVFSGEDGGMILTLARLAGVDTVQLHGGEPEPVRLHLEATGFRTVRTLWPSGSRPAEPGDAGAGAGLLDFAARPLPWAVLLDSRSGAPADGTGASAKTLVGGTGVRLAQPVASQWAAWLRARQLRVILAGGLRPANVQAALSSIRPWGVDVSSGVEEPGRPGVKEPQAIRAFVQAVREWEVRDG